MVGADEPDPEDPGDQPLPAYYLASAGNPAPDVGNPAGGEEVVGHQYRAPGGIPAETLAAAAEPALTAIQNHRVPDVDPALGFPCLLVCAPIVHLREYCRSSIDAMPVANGRTPTMPGGNVLPTRPVVGLHASLCRACVRSIVALVVGLHASLCRACVVSAVAVWVDKATKSPR